MIEGLLYAKLQPELKKSINNAYLEIGTYEQMIKHIERRMELNSLVSYERLVKTMTATKTNQNKDQKSKLKNQTNIPNDKMVKKTLLLLQPRRSHANRLSKTQKTTRVRQ